MTIDKAVLLVRQYYENAKNNKSIRDPIAWALYQAWREAEEGGDKP